VAAVHQGAGGKGGRPPSRQISPQRLLSEFETHATAQHRLRKPTSKLSFCDAIGKSKPTLANYQRGYNFPWPLVPANRLVVLCEDLYPHELLWVSRSLAQALRYESAEMLLGKSWLEAFRPGEQPSSEILECLEQLRRGRAVAYEAGSHLVSSDGRWLDVHGHVRWGSESQAFYVAMEPLGDLHAPPGEQTEVLNVVPGVRWIMHPVRDGDSHVVRLDSLQTLLEVLKTRNGRVWHTTASIAAAVLSGFTLLDVASDGRLDGLINFCHHLLTHRDLHL
jgi:hypothetical protein